LLLRSAHALLTRPRLRLTTTARAVGVVAAGHEATPGGTRGPDAPDAGVGADGAATRRRRSRVRPRRRTRNRSRRRGSGRCRRRRSRRRRRGPGWPGNRRRVASRPRRRRRRRRTTNPSLLPCVSLGLRHRRLALDTTNRTFRHACEFRHLCLGAAGVAQHLDLVPLHHVEHPFPRPERERPLRAPLLVAVVRPVEGATPSPDRPEFPEGMRRELSEPAPPSTAVGFASAPRSHAPGVRACSPRPPGRRVSFCLVLNTA
jgi:hypothetical protein